MTSVDRIAQAVLYEGYILYPYRPSVKNQQRWTFGGLYPRAFCSGGADAPANQTACLVHGSATTVLDVSVRFLHLIERRVGAIEPPLADWPTDQEPAFRSVESLRLGEQIVHCWQEAEERQIDLIGLRLSELVHAPRLQAFTGRGRRWLEPIAGPEGIGGVFIRTQEALAGSIEVSAVAVEPELYRVTVRVQNDAVFAGTERDAALLRSLVSTHEILHVRGGAFVSLLEPPDHWTEAASACVNVGTWPVLVGAAGATDTLLSSPIILYDYPQVAAESPGDLFDGTEIDEILSLRILTLTDEEKRSAAGLDPRARELLARTEALAPDEFSKLHGTIRPVAEETA